MLGTFWIYNPQTQQNETYHINGGQARRGKAHKIVIAGNVPMDQQHEICNAVAQLERVLLKAQGWDGKMRRIDDRD